MVLPLVARPTVPSWPTHSEGKGAKTTARASSGSLGGVQTTSEFHGESFLTAMASNTTHFGKMMERSHAIKMPSCFRFGVRVFVCVFVCLFGLGLGLGWVGLGLGWFGLVCLFVWLVGVCVCVCHMCRDSMVLATSSAKMADRVAPTTLRHSTPSRTSAPRSKPK